MSSPESAINAQGQTMVPAEVRNRLGIVPGTRLVWHVMPDGRILIRAKTGSLRDMAGILRHPEGKRVHVDDMNPFR
jgi:AbrB family looped-hinge helix DNA binding protein